MVLKLKVEELQRDLTKSNFPTKRVAEMNEIGLAHMAELTRLLSRAKKLIGGVNCDDPELVKVVSVLVRVEAGVNVATEGFQHELDAAKIVEENGLAVLTAIEGKTSISSKISLRRDYMVKEITKTKLDAATLANANKSGGGRGGGGGARGAPRGRGRGGGGGRGGGAAKPSEPMTAAKLARLKCYSCQGTGHLSNNCPNPKNA
jgi:uncharacterized membrane protein YgcG